MLIPPLNLRARIEAGLFVPDFAFDAHLPTPLRDASRRFWTPLDVARRVAEWLSAAGVRRALDVGSGSGKFCIAAAMSSDLTLIGVERRAHLVATARDLSSRFDLDERVAFLSGEPDTALFHAVDALYFYNPFEENLFGRDYQLDQSVDLSAARFLRDIAAIEAMLARVPVGTRLVTYNGFGGRICASYELENKCSMHHNTLRMWIKTDRPPDRRWWCEMLTGESLEETP